MRLPRLSYEKLTPRRKEVYDKHVARRDRVAGPYHVLGRAVLVECARRQGARRRYSRGRRA